MKKWIDRASCGLCFFLIALSGLCFAIRGVGLDASLYLDCQLQSGVCEAAGVDAPTLRYLDECLADCLDTGVSALERMDEVEVFGARQRAFNAREIAHMRDCARLFALCRRVAWLSLAGAAALLCTNSVRRRGRARWAWTGALCLLAPIGAFALWAAADFNSAFNFFHRLLFSNDLWLLNPETDLLIRLCPQNLFARMGVRIGAIALGAMLLPPALMTAWEKVRLRRTRIEENR